MCYNTLFPFHFPLISTVSRDLYGFYLGSGPGGSATFQISVVQKVTRQQWEHMIGI